MLLKFLFSPKGGCVLQREIEQERDRESEHTTEIFMSFLISF